MLTSGEIVSPSSSVDAAFYSLNIGRLCLPYTPGFKKCPSLSCLIKYSPSNCELVLFSIWIANLKDFITRTSCHKKKVAERVCSVQKKISTQYTNYRWNLFIFKRCILMHIFRSLQLQTTPLMRLSMKKTEESARRWLLIYF